MSEPVRMTGAVVGALRFACNAHPDQRVMQVIVNALGFTFDGVRPDPFYVEDKEAHDLLMNYGYEGYRDA